MFGRGRFRFATLKVPLKRWDRIRTEVLCSLLGLRTRPAGFPLLQDPGSNDSDEGHAVKSEANRPQNQRSEFSARDHKSLAQRVLDHGADHHGQNQRGGLEPDLPQGIADDAEERHGIKIHVTRVHTVDAHETQQNDDGEKDGFGDLI